VIETQVLYEAGAAFLSVDVDDFQASGITVSVVWLLAKMFLIVVCRPIAGGDCEVGNCTMAVARQ
jgi:hypothetical protein